MLPEAAGTAEFGLHPALFDAAMHADLLLSGPDAPTLLPFVWSGVTLYATGARELRVRILRISGDEQSLIQVADAAGNPVASVDSLVSRPVTESGLDSAAERDVPLLGVTWQDLPLQQAIDEGEPEVLVCPEGDDVHAVVAAVLAALQGR